MTTRLYRRVKHTPSGTGTSRVPSLEFPLLLSGDESGDLLLSGDAQTGTDPVLLQGDEAHQAVTHTKRIA